MTSSTDAYQRAYKYLQDRLESIGYHGWAHDMDGEIEAALRAAPPTTKSYVHAFSIKVGKDDGVWFLHGEEMVPGLNLCGEDLSVVLADLLPAWKALHEIAPEQVPAPPAVQNDTPAKAPVGDKAGIVPGGDSSSEKPQSDTPRTDAIPWIPNPHFVHATDPDLNRFVQIKEVRQLERELAAANRSLDWCGEQIKGCGQYTKDGETIFEALERNWTDSQNALGLFAKERIEKERLEAALSARLGSMAIYDPATGKCRGECDCSIGQTCKAYLVYRGRLDRRKDG